MIDINEPIREILAFQIHDTVYEQLDGQDKLSVDQAEKAINALILSKQKEARLDELKRANQNIVSVDFNLASKHKWYHYHNYRLRDLKELSPDINNKEVKQ